MRPRLLKRLGHLRYHAIDADQTDLRNVQAPEAYLRQPFTAADVENPIAGPRPERLGKEFGEFVRPPSLPKMLDGGGSEAVDGSGHA